MRRARPTLFIMTTPKSHDGHLPPCSISTRAARSGTVSRPRAPVNAPEPAHLLQTNKVRPHPRMSVDPDACYGGARGARARLEKYTSADRLQRHHLVRSFIARLRCDACAAQPRAGKPNALNRRTFRIARAGVVASRHGQSFFSCRAIRRAAERRFSGPPPAIFVKSLSPHLFFCSTEQCYRRSQATRQWRKIGGAF